MSATNSAPIQREVERAPGIDVVERGHPGVQRHEERQWERGGVNLSRVVHEDLLDLIRGWTIEGEVRSAVDDGFGLFARLDPGRPHDLVNIALRLGRCRPDPESWIPNQGETLLGHRPLEHVRPSPRHAGLALLIGLGGSRDRIGERERKLVQELRIGPVKVERDRAVRIVGRDSLRQVARPRLLDTGWSPDDPSEEIERSSLQPPGY